MKKMNNSRDYSQDSPERKGDKKSWTLANVFRRILRFGADNGWQLRYSLEVLGCPKLPATEERISLAEKNRTAPSCVAMET